MYNILSDHKKPKPGRKLFILLCLTTIFDLALLCVRIYKAGGYETDLNGREVWYFGPGKSFLFLVWNLFLAWIPYWLAHNLERIDRRYRSRLFTGGLILIWLLFFPNAPYIITDLLHLRERPPIPKWYDMMLIFSFAWTGLMLGYLSLLEVQRFWKRRFGGFRAWLFTLTALWLSGLGIFLGRFQRWNSWDILYRPWALLSDLAEVLTQPVTYMDTLGIAIVLSGMLTLGYLTLISLTYEKI